MATKLPVTEPGLLLPQLTPLRRCHALTSFLTLPIPARSEGKPIKDEKTEEEKHQCLYLRA